MWVKVYSVIIGACLILLLRTHKLNKLKYLIYVLLILNISVAVIQGLLCGNHTSLINALSGILLILTLPKARIISIDPNGCRDLLWNAPYPWIIGYTGWNWIFGIQCLGANYGIAAAVLLAPLVIAYQKKDLWLQARTCTLAFFLIINFSKFFTSPIPTPSFHLSPSILLGISCFFFLWMIGHTIKSIRSCWI